VLFSIPSSYKAHASTGKSTEKSPEKDDGQKDKTQEEELAQKKDIELPRRFKFIDVQDRTRRKRGRTRVNEQPMEEPQTPSEAVVPKSIMFVDINDPESRREARSHVQREAKGHRETPEIIDFIPEMDLHNTFQNLGMQLAEDVHDPATYFGHPQTMLNPNQMDPFSNFPINLDHPRQELMNHFMTLSSRWLAHFHTEAFYNPIRDAVIPVGMAHPAGIHIILGYSAFSMALFKGEKEPVEALQHKSKAFALINEGLQDPSQRLSDGLLSAVVAAVWLEHRWGTPESLLTHLDGLNQMLQSRGGPRSIRSNRFLDLTVSWHQILTGSIQASRLKQMGATKPINPCNPGTNIWHYLGMLASLLENLNVWIRLSQDTLPTDPNFDQIHFINTRREATFGQRGPLYTILSTLTTNEHFQGQAATSQSCRIASLIYLNLVLWEYRNSPESYTSFLQKLNLIFFHTQLDRNRGIEALTWVLIKDLDDKPARKWDVLQLMVVVEILCQESKDRVQGFLLGSLAVGLGEDLTPLGAHEIEAIRMEVTNSLPGPDPWDTASVEGTSRRSSRSPHVDRAA
jgi:hypothetical protein